MEWTKIKTRHFYADGKTYAEKGRLATLLCMVAHLERIPSDEEIKSSLGRNFLEMTVKSLRNDSESTVEIMQKVMEDVERLQRKRKRDAEYQKGCDKSRHRGQADDSPAREEKRREEKNKEREKHPTLPEVKGYFQEAGSSWGEGEKFFDYFTSNGWKVGGKATMKDWRASARNWIRRNGEQKKPVGRAYNKDNEEFSSKMEKWKKEADEIPSNQNA